MSKNLFSEFAPSNKKTWQEQAEKEMNENLEKLKSTSQRAKIRVEPYLTAEDLNYAKVSDVQSAQKKVPGWLNFPKLKFSDPRATNFKIRAALESGANGVILDLDHTDLTKCEFPKLLHAIRLSDFPIYFENVQDPEILFDLISKGAGYYIKGGMACDPIANWMRTGNNYNAEISGIVELMNKTRNMREFLPVMVDGHIFHNAGADPVQEIAFSAATLVSYVDILTDLGIHPLMALNRFFFSISIGTEYISEIAKLRALRFVYRKITRAYKLPDELCNAFIHAKTSSFYNSELVPHNNMIRATTEAMSAVVGGCNALTVLPYDNSFKVSDEFSERIATNISSVMASETYLAHVADPSAGSYTIENLSIDMADAAWELFLKVEDQGGIFSSFKNGFVQDEIEKSWSEKIISIKDGRILIGVNKFRPKVSEHIFTSYKQTVGETEAQHGIRTLPSRSLSSAMM